jgi:hypothetical protein
MIDQPSGSDVRTARMGQDKIYHVEGKASFELLTQRIVFVNDVDLLEHRGDLLLEALFDAANTNCQLFSA